MQADRDATSQQLVEARQQAADAAAAADKAAAAAAAQHAAAAAAAMEAKATELAALRTQLDRCAVKRLVPVSTFVFLDILLISPDGMDYHDLP